MLHVGTARSMLFPFSQLSWSNGGNVLTQGRRSLILLHPPRVPLFEDWLRLNFCFWSQALANWLPPPSSDFAPAWNGNCRGWTIGLSPLYAGIFPNDAWLPAT